MKIKTQIDLGIQFDFPFCNVKKSDLNDKKCKCEGIFQEFPSTIYLIAWAKIEVSSNIAKRGDKNIIIGTLFANLATLIRGICDLLQNTLNIVSRWCDQNELSINPEKTTMILFTRNRKIEGIRIPFIKEIPIKLANLVKYLGIIFDSKLLWIANLDSRIEKAIISYGNVVNPMAPHEDYHPKYFTGSILR